MSESKTPRTDAVRECIKQEIGNRQASPATAFALRTMHDLERALTAAQPSEDDKPSAPSISAERVLFENDSFCPKCGHNRDQSSVSSIDMEDGTYLCQVCGASWRESGVRVEGE